MSDPGARRRKWVVTGGAGFIGCHAAARFHGAGDEVVVVDNLSRRGAEENLAWLRGRGVTDFVRLDVRDRDGVDRLLAEHADADVVLHLAGQVAVTTSVARPAGSDFEINALGTLNVLEAVRLQAERAAGGAYTARPTRSTATSTTYQASSSATGGIPTRTSRTASPRPSLSTSTRPYGCS